LRWCTEPRQSVSLATAWNGARPPLSSIE
jgi:hypothetical protein